MILVCPQCSTRYKTDAAKFPAEGRNVRCAKCGNVWHQMPEPDEAEAPVPQPAPAPQPEPPPEEVRSEPVPVIREPERPVFVPDNLSAAAPQSPAEAPSKGSRLGAIVGWLLFLLVLVGLGAALFVFRQQIVALWPQSATLYSTVGLETNTRGIAFEKVDYVKALDGGQVVFIVTGTLRNITDHEVPVSQIRVGLSDASKREIYHWTFSADAATMQPGQSLAFRTRLTNPPPAAHNISVRFVNEGE